ncbi:MAG: hypothetical protein JSR59_00935 [Proteobacteria bacterium]|nr:hypothetical protein [Pseudomonadota bacterium]
MHALVWQLAKIAVGAICDMFASILCDFGDAYYYASPIGNQLSYAVERFGVELIFVPHGILHVSPVT